MPGQGGLEVLKILRSKPATAALPVVVLTAMDDEASTRAGFELGATDYVTKPFSIPSLPRAFVLVSSAAIYRDDPFENPAFCTQGGLISRPERSFGGQIE